MGIVTCISDLNSDSVQKILQDFFKDTDLKVTEMSGHEKFLGTNENYSSDITSISVSFKHGDGSESQINFVTKTTIESVFFKRMSTFIRAFAKEIFWFKRGLPTLVKVCPELKDLSPICYYGYSNYEDRMFRPKNAMDRSVLIARRMFLNKPELGIILLGNLKTGDQPLKMLDRKVIVTPDQCRVVFQTLAKLHGSWLKWKNQEVKEETSDGIRDVDVKSLDFQAQPWMIKPSLKSTHKILSGLLLSHGKPELAQRWNKYSKEQMFKRVMQNLSQECEKGRSKIVTLCHGDLWINNMMFTQDETKVTFLDYQIMQILHPSRDIWYFLAGATDADFRREHLQGLLRDYFQVLQAYLVDLGISLTFEEFEKEIHDRRDYLVVYTVTFMPTFIETEKIEVDTWRSMKELMKKREVEIGRASLPNDSAVLVEIRRRLIGLVEEAADCGFI